MRFLDDLIAIGVATVVLLATILLLPHSPIRVALGLPFVLFFPGYTLIAALYPRRDDLDGIERLALSLGLSLAVVPLIGLVLNYTPWGIRLGPIVAGLTMLPLPRSFPPPGGSDGGPAPAVTPLRCRLCASAAVERTPLLDGNAWCECRTCGLTFVVPKEAHADPVSVYSLAYAGRLQEAGMRDFFVKLAMRSDADAVGVPARKMLNSGHRAAVAVLRREFPRGCTVFDIGCGAGYFLRAIKELNYAPFGLDVAEPIVQLLRAEGFPVWHGTIDSMPPGWVDPQVCTSFFMIHHLVDPVRFIRTVRREFPRALLIIAAYNDLDRPCRAKLSDRELPPRVYSWWGQKQLALALQQGGYRAIVEPVKAQAREGGLAVAVPFYTSLNHRTPALARRLLALYYDTLPVWGWPKALWMRWRGLSKFVMAVGYPEEEAPGQGGPRNGSGG